MTAAVTLVPPSSAPLDVGDDIAVRVEGVSKTYALWSSPSARLKYSLLALARHVSPPTLRARLEARGSHLCRPFRALETISFDIKKGESWGIIGVNGSGKSTLLKMISGNLQPSTGRIIVDGKVAILDYSSGLHGGFTGRENVYLKAATHGMSRQQIDEKFDSIAAFADIGDFIDQPVKTYSSGMQARLGFAILAHVDADIIITDEALAVGDAFFVQKCMAYIRKFLEHGTFIFVSHSTNDVISLCQKAVWLDHGKVREIGSAKEVGAHYLAHSVMKTSELYEAKEREISQLNSTDTAAEAEDRRETTASKTHRVEQSEIATIRDHRPVRKIRDRRQEMLDRTQWRNDIIVPEFNTQNVGIGTGGAKIQSVSFEDEEGAQYSSIVGGELVRVKIVVRAMRDLLSPIVGFQVIDRLGQVLFGDNTYITTITNPLSVDDGETFAAVFSFQMPLLPVGEYAVRAAVARGSETGASMMHVIDTALVFRSVSSAVRYGLVGVAMEYIEIFRDEAPSVTYPKS